MASDPAYLRTFKIYTKSRATGLHQDEMEKEFYGESDRACGILFASWTELIIERSIKDKLKPDPPSALFDFDGPLGTFSAKIMMAYAMDLFGHKTNHDLMLIRTMRNEFAHCQLPLRFELPEVKAVCAHLMLPDVDGMRVMPQYFIRKHGELPQHWYDAEHPKTRFVTCCYTIIYKLFEIGATRLPGVPEPSKLP
jgi:hypothetical protein